MQFWENFTITTDANCGCCGNVSSDCFLTLPTILVDGDDTPYANINVAQDALNTRQANCILEMGADGDPAAGFSRSSYDAQFVSNNISYNSVTALANSSGGGDTFLVRLNVSANTSINMSANGSFTASAGAPYSSAIEIFAYDDTYNLITSNSFPSTTLSPSANLEVILNNAGTYYFIGLCAGGTENTNIGDGSGTGVQDFFISANTTITVCAVRAAYGDPVQYLSCP